MGRSDTGRSTLPIQPDPSRVGSHDSLEEALEVRIKGHPAHLAASYAGLRILDLTELSAPAEIGFASRGGYDHGAAWNLELEGDFAYTVIQSRGPVAPPLTPRVPDALHMSPRLAR